MTARVHECLAPDGQRLVTLDVGPEAGSGVVIAGHAMMVDGKTLLRDDRPCLARTLADQGLRVLVPDLRGHGRSGPRAEEGGDWSYEDLVADVPVYLDLARTLAPDRPVYLLGHSLFGHVSLAALALNPALPVAGVVALAVDVWQARNEPSALRWALKVGVLGGTTVVARMFGRVPVRAVRLGTNDEAASYWSSFWPLVGRGWRAPSGIRLQDALVRIQCPVLHVVSHGDRLYARPASALRFSSRIRSRQAIELGRTDHPDLLGLCPDHMGMVTDPACLPLWREIGRWISEQVALGRVPSPPTIR